MPKLSWHLAMEMERRKGRNTAITNWQRNSVKKEGRKEGGIANRMRDDENGQLSETVMRCHAQDG